MGWGQGWGRGNREGMVCVCHSKYDYVCSRFSSEEQSGRIYPVHLFAQEVVLRLRTLTPEE